MHLTGAALCFTFFESKDEKMILNFAPEVRKKLSCIGPIFFYTLNVLKK